MITVQVPGKAMLFGEWNILEERHSCIAFSVNCYAKASIQDDYVESIKIIKKAIKSNPEDSVLLNNIAFAYASLGDVRSAYQWFNKINVRKLNINSLVAHTATRGLLFYRDGDANLGRKMYEKAIDLANTLQLEKYKTLATIYFAREEILSGSENASNVLERAKKYLINVSDKDVLVVFNRVKKMFEKAIIS